MTLKPSLVKTSVDFMVSIISGNKGTAQSKINALESANIAVAPSPAKMGETMLAEMQKGYN